MNTNMTGFRCDFFRNRCILVRWMKVASALERLNGRAVRDKRVSLTNSKLCRRLFPTRYQYITLKGLVCENEYIY